MIVSCYGLHLTFAILRHYLDEELGGDAGMKIFVKTEAFKRMNVGFSLGI